ncbi:hypothetical protein Y032_0310g2103 [Ancylostoma ceylanicum]|uniref:Uncharacterized protein n=1 Tax=Ancylostoma ceylanicum TaxID=53326 RepID=A0A016S296_9BILA|nr:hypothetical protein Y032_0310g2103 [Ancylostoma ceylanicum]
MAVAREVFLKLHKVRRQRKKDVFKWQTKKRNIECVYLRVAYECTTWHDVWSTADSAPAGNRWNDKTHKLCSLKQYLSYKGTIR